MAPEQGVEASEAETPPAQTTQRDVGELSIRPGGRVSIPVEILERCSALVLEFTIINSADDVQFSVEFEVSSLINFLVSPLVTCLSSTVKRSLNTLYELILGCDVAVVNSLCL